MGLFSPTYLPDRADGDRVRVLVVGVDVLVLAAFAPHQPAAAVLGRVARLPADHLRVVAVQPPAEALLRAPRRADHGVLAVDQEGELLAAGAEGRGVVVAGVVVEHAARVFLGQGPVAVEELSGRILGDWDVQARIVSCSRAAKVEGKLGRCRSIPVGTGQGEHLEDLHDGSPHRSKLHVGRRAQGITPNQ